MPSQNFRSYDVQRLKSGLIKRRDEAKYALRDTHRHARDWLDQNQVEFKALRQKSQKLLATASLAAAVLLSPPPISDLTTPHEIKAKLNAKGFMGSDELESDLAHDLAVYVPPIPGHATSQNESLISMTIQQKLGITAVPQLDGQRLNHSYGWMGYEQHLKRFPGDDLSGHDEEQIAGIAPGLGGWGYFAYSSADLTPEVVLKEKYYFAVQTLYLPHWKSDLSHLVKWYKHRKMIAINPENGKAVVGVVADAGPAKFTGKQFGGSPEAMTHLDLIHGKKKGKVILYFVDDPDNKIPLGPVSTNYQLPPVLEI